MPTAIDLKPGDMFKWRSGQRKWREVQTLTVLTEGSFRGPKEFIGHIIVGMPYCKQVTLPPGQLVQVATTDKSLLNR